MKNVIKSYLVFTSHMYRLVVFLLLPAAFAGGSLWMLCYGGSAAGRWSLVIIVLLLPVVETLSDSWVFPGIQRRDSAGLDCLKTSARGRDVLKRALIVDMVRKLISSVMVPGLVYAVLRLWGMLSGGGEGGPAPGAFGGASGLLDMSGGDGAALWCLGMLSFFYSVLGTFLSRYGNMIWLNVLVGYELAGLEMASLFLPGFFLYPYAYGAVFGLLGLGAGTLAVRTAMGKLERSYYDERGSRSRRQK